MSIREVIPESADELKIKHEEVFKEKIPIIEKILGDLRKKTPGERLGQGGQEQHCPKLAEGLMVSMRLALHRYNQAKASGGSYLKWDCQELH